MSDTTPGAAWRHCSHAAIFLARFRKHVCAEKKSVFFVQRRYIRQHSARDRKVLPSAHQGAVGGARQTSDMFDTNFSYSNFFIL